MKQNFWINTTNTERFGAQRIGEVAYFDVFDGIKMSEQIERAGRKAGISIEVDSQGVHDRGWKYTTYIVKSARRYDPRVDTIADGLHALSSKLFRECLPGDTSRVDLF